MYCKVGAILHIVSNPKHFSMLVENNYLVLFEYMDIHILINSFTANPGCWQMHVAHILP